MNQRPRLNPKLVAFDSQPVQHNGQPALLLKEKLGLSDRGVIVPQYLLPLLGLCDGTRDAATLRTAFLLRFGVSLSASVIERILEELEDASLLEGPRLEEARVQALQQYRNAPHRPMLLAGKSYPAEASELRAALDAYCQPYRASTLPIDGARGVVSPHIDFARGGYAYAQTWLRAAAAVRNADLAVVFGTDHLSGQPSLTLTRQDYATPFGALPTDGIVVDVVAESVGAEWAFEDELHHAREHSIELAVVWLHYLREGRPLPIVPILCGSFGPLMTEGNRSPLTEDRLAAALDVLRAVIAERRAIVVAAGDLSHVGPAFGDPYSFGLPERARISAADAHLLRLAAEGDPEGFFASVSSDGDRHHVCGLSPIYCLLQLLRPCHGEVVGYTHCPADANGGSFVSIAGIVLQ